MKTGKLTLSAAIEQWPLAEPFRITGFVWTSIDVLRVTLEKDGQVGQGEAAGAYYKNDKPATMLQQVEALRPMIEAGLTRADLQGLLPPGGARNALDCAFWDLEAKLGARPVWEIAGMQNPKPLLTTFTCGAESPQKMAATARSYTSARAIKLKLTGEELDADRVFAVRKARPDVWLGIDANQGFTIASLKRLMPLLVESDVKLIEQPFRTDDDSSLAGFESPIPIGADESLQSLADIPRLAGRFSVANIKLDKCGGLTEALQMARAAQAQGLRLMVGNMLSTSLAMAPAFLVGQLCDIVDLDGPVFLKSDRPAALQYSDGYVTCPEALWGYPGDSMPRRN